MELLNKGLSPFRILSKQSFLQANMKVKLNVRVFTQLWTEIYNQQLLYYWVGYLYISSLQLEGEGEKKGQILLSPGLSMFPWPKTKQYKTKHQKRWFSFSILSYKISFVSLTQVLYEVSKMHYDNYQVIWNFSQSTHQNIAKRKNLDVCMW